ncbi:hypothetical protein [Georgenia alba]|uniref:Uncharacterized protein n=1 Tax=Georgenia alba TaxID=2233858 RepID=A0ABW2Q3D6_9MICO
MGKSNDGVFGHNTGVSQEVQYDLDAHAGNLENWLSENIAAAKALAGGYVHDGVSDQHQAILADFVQNGEETKGIIQMLRQAMTENDEIGQGAQRRAEGALPI